MSGTKPNISQMSKSPIKSSHKSSKVKEEDQEFKSAEKPDGENQSECSYEGPIPIPPMPTRGRGKRSVTSIQSNIKDQIEQSNRGRGRRGKQSAQLPKDEDSVVEEED